MSLLWVVSFIIEDNHRSSSCISFTMEHEKLKEIVEPCPNIWEKIE